MPLSEKQEAAIRALETRTTPSATTTNNTTTSNTTKASTKTPLQISYPDLTDKVIGELFGDDDDATKDFKYIMNGMDKWARDAIVKKGVYGQSKQYFSEATNAAIKMADYYTTNVKKLTTQKQADEFNAELNLMRKDYYAKHTLANISLTTVIGDKQKTQYLKGDLKAKGMSDFGEDREGSKLVFDYDTRKIITKQYAEEKSENVFKSDKFYTDLKTKKDDPWYVDMWNAMGPGGGINKSLGLNEIDMTVESSIDKTAGYKAFYKGAQNRPKEVDYRLDYFIKNWTQEAIFLTGKDQISKFKKQSDYYTTMNKTRGYVNDILMAAKTSKNTDIQNFASKLNKGLAERKGDWPGTMEFIRANANDISSIVNNKEFSYYAKENLYNKYKTVYNKTKFISDPENKLSTEYKAKLIDKYSSQLDFGLTNLKTQRADYKKTKEDVRANFAADTIGEKLLKKTMFNQQGDLLSYNSWIKQFPEDGRTSDLYTAGVKKYDSYMNQLKAAGNYSVLEMRQAVMNRLSATEKNELVQYGLVYKFNTRDDLYKGPSNSNLKEDYNNYKTKYKESFTNFDVKGSFARSSMENGLGANGMYSLEQRQINFAKGTSKKAVNASELITKITKSLEGGESDMVVLNRNWNNIDSKRDFDGTSDKEHLSLINNFFKDKDKSNFNLTYINKYKDPGNVVYIFKNLTTQKEISIAMPKATAKGFKESFAMAEYDDSDDFHFDLKGEKDLQNYMGATKHTRNARIYQDSGEKIFEAEVDVWNAEKQKFEPQKFTKSLGPSIYLPIDDATTAAINWLKEYEKELAPYNN